MIDLAPNHKIGLTVPNPILLAGQTIGYGEACHKALQTNKLGGVVVGPILRHSSGGAPVPRLAETPNGMVLAGGLHPRLQNRGVSAVIKRFANLWPKLGCPVIAQIAEPDPHALAQVVERLERTNLLDGLELLPPRHIDPSLLHNLIQTVIHHSDLPLWVKLPLENSIQLAKISVEAGASAIVMGQPLMGAATSMVESRSKSQLVTGALYGPTTFAPMLAELTAVAQLQLPCALIACGGIHTVEQVRQALHYGAHAIQMDSAVWIEPELPSYFVEKLA